VIGSGEPWTPPYHDSEEAPQGMPQQDGPNSVTDRPQTQPAPPAAAPPRAPRDGKRRRARIGAADHLYEERGRALGALVDRKQREYGDSFHRSEAIVRALWPNGIPVEAYTDALAVIRVIDKLFRVAAGKQGDEDPWCDIAGYGLLGANEG
jgi:hypothetical protein